MKYNPVGWFEIPVTDMERAKKFYEDLLGVVLKRENSLGYEMVTFPMENNTAGSPGALMKGAGYEPSPFGVVVYFTCPDLDEALDVALTMGANIVLPKKDIGEYGYIAWIEDSEGNTIALHTAK